MMRITSSTRGAFMLHFNRRVPCDQACRYTKSAFLSYGADTAAADDAEVLKGSRAKQHQPRPIFPWRHDAKNMLPRIATGPDVVLSPAGLNIAHGLFLNRTPGAGLIGRLVSSFASTSQWRTDLADSASWAFVQSVGGILSNTYAISDQRIITTEENKPDMVSLQFGVPTTPTEQASKEDGVETENSENSSTEPEKDAMREGKPIDASAMVHPQLQKLYESSHEWGKDQLRVRLEMKPTGVAMLYNLFLFPFLTREMVESNDKLQGMIQNMYVDGRFVANMAKTNEIYDHVFYNILAGQPLTHANTTVELQVLVECDEVFQVFDESTGAVLQGSPDGKSERVLHLARFETEVQTSGGMMLSDLIVGNWKLTDIDDLLGDRTWYHGK